MTKRRVSVVIADRHPVVLCGLMTVLRAESDFNVVASCRDGARCIEAIRDLFPDLALLDISLPGLLQVLAAIKSENLCTRVICFSASSDDSATATAIARGAYGVIPKAAGSKVVVRCLRQVASGQRMLPLAMRDPESRSSHEHGPRGALENLPIALTERERKVMHLVCEGLSNKKVGRQLNISEGTIKVHLHHIYEKLAIHNRTTLAALAARDVEQNSERKGRKS